jgi:hypothetical protein
LEEIPRICSLRKKIYLNWSAKNRGADDIEAKELSVASHIMLWLVEILFIGK